MKKKRKENLKPNFFAWTIYRTYSILRMKRRNNIKYDRTEFKNRNKKEGCVILYNHCCMSDHFINTGLFAGTRVNYVITKRFTFFVAIRTVLKTVRAISRDQFKNDTSSILKMKRVVEAGGIICIAPAGQVSIHGEQPYINPIIVKLLKMCKADVYTIQTHGSYLAYPKWGTGKRKYPIYSKIVKTLSKEELKSLSQEECFEKIVKDMDVQDRLYQKEKMIPIKSEQRALGLENILYICPKCGKKYTTYTKGNEIICSNCNNTIHYNKYGFLEGVGDDYVLFQDEALWYNYQKQYIMNKLKKGEYTLKSTVDLYSNTIDEFKLDCVGKGVLEFDGNSLIYKGTMNDKEIVKEFNLHTIYQLPFAPAVRFNIPDEEGMFEFVTENKREIIEWVQLVDALNSLKLEEEANGSNNI